ncbi:hypothetical protein [Tateyamaria sp. 1078]|uniref:hypothetical protein n=1 Tax=Tateyamaria sp. 1078 TaxID=3417464 RepID=UPI003EB749AB
MINLKKQEGRQRAGRKVFLSLGKRKGRVVSYDRAEPQLPDAAGHTNGPDDGPRSSSKNRHCKN